MMRSLALLLIGVQAWAGYAYKATVAFSGATGSTQTNITLAFSFSDAKLKTVSNGGQVQNLCSRNGNSVPCDFVVTNDSTCGSLTGSYKWGFDGDYSATAGTGHGWLLIPSYTTGGVSPTLCVGNAAVSTYQGGTVGAEFDSNTYAAYHMSDSAASTTITDYASGGHSMTNAANTNGKSVPGEVGLALTFNGSTDSASESTSSLIPTSTNASIIQWLKFTSLPSASAGTAYVGNSASDGIGLILSDGSACGSGSKIGVIAGGKSCAPSAGFTVSTGVWYCVAMSISSGTVSLYVNGVFVSSGAVTPNAPSAVAALKTTAAGAAVLIDDTVLAAARTSDWIASACANQSKPPSVGAFSAISGAVANQSVISIQ